MIAKDNLPTYIRRAILAALIILSAVLQSTRHGFPTVFGCKAVLLLPLTVVISMFERGFAGMCFGLFSGLLADIFSAEHDGFYIIVFTLIGFTCGTLITYYLRNNIVTAAILSAFAAVAVNTAYWLLFIVMKKTDMAALLYFRYYLPGAVYTAVFTPPYYYIVMKLSNKIREPRRTFSYREGV